MILPARQIIILAGSDDWLDEQVRVFFPPEETDKSTVVLDDKNFFKARNLLGQEFDWILYDARSALNLEALAMAGGTLRAGGVLLMLFNRWDDLTEWRDGDSLRWSGENPNGEKQPIFTPHFLRFFKQKVAKYQIPVYRESQLATALPNTIASEVIKPQSAVEKELVFDTRQPTHEQQAVLRQILKRDAEMYLVTAKRGRGKSALAGFLARELQSVSRVILTAPNKSAVKILQDFAITEPEFIAPDELCRQIRQNPRLFEQDWLLIDEAAMIPLDLLNCLTSAFRHILCTTTIHSYEGTGRGFVLKFMKNIDRTFQQFGLTKPLRWAQGDLLEAFIDDLLLLQAEDELPQPDYTENADIRMRFVSQSELIKQPETLYGFYGLLTLAHYRTSPLDLRRLFDAPQQRFLLAESADGLLGCVWATEEGGLCDEQLIQDICRGVRRPRGNLAAQMLAFQYDLPQACALTSLRISRIAVQPKWQQKGIGRRLIEHFAMAAEVDFLSVSFGYTAGLAHFWQQCGFVLVLLGEHKESSSGCYTTLALRPLTETGNILTNKVSRDFRRNIGLSFHPLAEKFPFSPDWQLNQSDWQILQNFADFNRTLSSSLPAIRRLLAVYGGKHCPLLEKYCTQQQKNEQIDAKKQWLRQCRAEVGNLLQKI